MMVVTPGLDLKPITNGSDYTFILDVSGSMRGKIYTLAQGVKKTLSKLTQDDRFRIISFSDNADWIIKSWTNATNNNIQDAILKVENLNAGGSTNIYDGLSLAVNNLDADRVSSILLVTDGVTNSGIVNPKDFYKLMKQYDVRVFGFLMGNSCNWPLMRAICDATGGFYKGVSNNDDIIGQILLAKSKIKYECLHDVDINISGVKVHDTSEFLLGKVYRGQQLVLFGRYTNPGDARVQIKAKLSGQDKVYSTTFNFPEIDTDNPEIERLWALDQIEYIEAKQNRGIIDEKEGKTAIRDLGVNYQIVTDETSMIVLSDETFTKRNIQRKNQAKIQIERKASSVRLNNPVRNYRVDQSKPAFSFNAPRLSSGGGGAFSPFTGLLILLSSLISLLIYKNNE
ncbi:hypothetical protein BVX93_00375 [bacterium B13(2017)]|nr:hypothetical protein BVX93_00375 [bacterium B13(2017)]